MNGNTETLNPGTSSQGGRMPEYSTSEEEAIDTEPVQLQPFIHQVSDHFQLFLRCCRFSKQVIMDRKVSGKIFVSL